MFKAASKKTISASLRTLADYAESNGANRHAVIAGLHRVKMALSQDAKEAVEAMGPLKADSRKEVMDGFKKQNPDLSEAELNEIADQWEKNKNVVKDKQAAKPDYEKLYQQMSADLDTFDMAYGRYRRDPVANKHKLDDALKYMKDLRDLSNVIIRNLEAEKAGKTAAAASEVSKLNDKTWEWTTDAMEALDKIAKEASAAVKKVDMLADKTALRGIEKKAREGRRTVAAVFGDVKTAAASDDEKQSRHEEGKPADPTEDMSPEDAKKWREMNDKYKDSLKKAMKSG